MTTTKPAVLVIVCSLIVTLMGCTGPAPGAELDPAPDAAKQGTAAGRLGTDQGAEMQSGGGQSQSVKSAPDAN